MTQSFMIAVTGGSGSGKTTLARALYARLGAESCQLVTEDNYYFGRAHYGAAALTMQHAELERTFNFDDPANKDMANLRRDINNLVTLTGRHLVWPLAVHRACRRRAPGEWSGCEWVHTMA